MKNPSPGDNSPFSSSSHEPGTPPPFASKPSPDSANLPKSVQEIMATNAKVNSGTGGTRLSVVKTSYKPSGKVGPLAWPLMLVLSLGGGALVGAMWHFLAPNFNTLLFTQLIMGGALGAILFIAATVGKVRSARFAAGWGVLGTLALYGTYHTLAAAEMRSEILDAFSQRIASSGKGGPSPAQVRAGLAKKFTLPRAIGLYWRENYKYGVTLRDDHTSSINGSSSGTHLDGIGYVILLMGEIGLASAFAALIPAAAASRRFSEETDRWFNRKRVFGLPASALEPTVRALEAQDWAKAASYGIKQVKQTNVGTVYASTVPGASTGWIEVIYAVEKQQKLLFERELPVEALRALGAIA